MTKGSPTNEPVSIACRRAARSLARDLADPHAAPERRIEQARRLRTLLRVFRAHFPVPARRIARYLGSPELDAPRLRSELEALLALQQPAPPSTEPGVRRATRRALARELRKLSRRGKRFGRRTPPEALASLLPPLERIEHLCDLFGEHASPQIDAFREHVTALRAAIGAAVGATGDRRDALRLEAIEAWRRFRKRRVRRLAVPDA